MGEGSKLHEAAEATTNWMVHAKKKNYCMLMSGHEGNQQKFNKPERVVYHYDLEGEMGRVPCKWGVGWCRRC